MKFKFFTLMVILVILIAGVFAYIKINRDNIAVDKNVSSEDISTNPTAVPASSTTPTPAVDSAKSTDLYPVYQVIKDNKKYGYINSTGEFVIEPAFDFANNFYDGYAVVYRGDRQLLIDATGSIIFTSDVSIGNYHNGAAIITKYTAEKTLYGYISFEGKDFVSPQYQMVSDFMEDGTAYVYSGNGKYALIDTTGKVLKDFELDSKYEPTSIQDGYDIYYDLQSGNYGVVDLKGEDIIKSNYSEITYLGEDLFSVKKPDEMSYGGMVSVPSALFKATGEQLSDYIFYDISCFYNGYASVTDSTHTYFINTDGNVVTDLPKFEGRGTLTLFGDIISANIDYDQFYSKKDGTVIWQNDNTQTLSDTIVAKSIKFKPNKYVTVYYPEIDGLSDMAVQKKINTELKSLFIDSRIELKESDMLSAEDTFNASLINNLLIVSRDGYDYYFGAAHGIPMMDYFYIDITDGTFYQFKDLFIKDSDYATVINKQINVEIAAQMESEGAMYFEGIFTGIPENPCFILSKKSLTVYFYPYEIAAYAAGFPEFEIPFEDIYDYVDFKGAFWNSFN